MALSIERASKTYFRGDKAIPALDDVTLSIAPGECVAVVGGRGSGKTTLLKIAAGLERPDIGAVSLDGVRIDGLRDRELTRLRREKLSLAASPATSFDGSRVRDLVELPLRLCLRDSRVVRSEAQRTLAALALSDYAGASIAELSDGERKLVTVAQALVTKPRYLLLDQPASGLRLGEERQLLGLLTKLPGESGVAILMTAHSVPEAIAASRVVSISAGRIFASDRPVVTDKPAEVLRLDERRMRPTGGGAGA